MGMPTENSKLSRFGLDLGAAALLFISTVTIQWCSGAFVSEFGIHPDEASHYVTGLMVHDYCWQHDWLHPRAFAEQYYIHYPKVALGHWPPFFYVLQALWMSVFSFDRVSMVLLMAVLTTWVAVIVYREGRSVYGWQAGLGMGVLFLLLPPVQEGSVALMADILVALLCMQAVLAFSRFLEDNRWQDACAFGVWSSLAIMTKGSGLALALLPLSALVLSRRFALLRRWTFWLPAVIVAVLCAPWYYLTLGMVQKGWFEDEVSGGYFFKAALFYMNGMFISLGAGLIALAVIGFCARLILPTWRGGASARWSAYGGWFVSSFLFQCLVPCGVEDRFLLPVLPVLVFAVAAGAEQVSRWLAGRSARPMPRLLGPVLIGILFLLFVNPLPKATAVFGYAKVANEVLRNAEQHGLALLVAADSCGEGMFVAEIAQRDRQHSHVVLRTSKVLSSSHWVGKDFTLRFTNNEDAARYLDQLSVDFIVLDMTVPLEKQLPDQRQLLDYLQSASTRYHLAGKFPLVRRKRVFPEGIHVYQLQSTGSSGPRVIRVDMGTMLGKTLEVALP